MVREKQLKGIAVEALTWTAIAGCYVSIIGMYVWIMKVRAEIDSRMSEHHENARIHMETAEIQRRDVCAETVQRFEDKIDATQGFIQDVKADMNNGFKELKGLLQNK